MKAVRLNGWGEQPQVEEIADPEPANDEVLVRVRAASLNPLDSVIAMGYMQGYVSTPMTLGTDFSGEVVSTGCDVSHVQPGDSVYGMIAFRSGTISEYALPKGSEVARMPKSLDYIDSAAMVLVSLAAWNAVHDLGHVKEGDRVLVLGAGGNVGSVAVRLAREAGAYVIGANRPGKEQFVSGLGLDEYIPLGEEGLTRAIDPVDVVLNVADDALFENGVKYLKRGGIYVSAIQPPSQEEADKRDIRVAGVYSQVTPELLTLLGEMMDAGKFHVTTRRVYPMQETGAAMMDRMMSREPGKVVVQIA